MLVHQTLHAHNVLRAQLQREPWLVIDRNPLAGEMEFAVAAIIRGAELDSADAVARRLIVSPPPSASTGSALAAGLSPGPATTSSTAVGPFAVLIGAGRDRTYRRDRIAEKSTVGEQQNGASRASAQLA